MKEKINKTLMVLSLLLGLAVTIFVIYLVLGNRSVGIILSGSCAIVAILIQMVVHLRRLKALIE